MHISIIASITLQSVAGKVTIGVHHYTDIKKTNIEAATQVDVWLLSNQTQMQQLLKNLISLLCCSY